MNTLERIREYVACPQFGDAYYGKLGAVSFVIRKDIKELVDYVTSLELLYIETVKEMKKLEDENDRLRILLGEISS